jgi:chromosome segregation ATPase
MSDQDTGVPNNQQWPDHGVRARLGSRLERHVLRSAVEILDERGTEVDGFERELRRREGELAERAALAEALERELEHRERRLAEIGAEHLRGQPRIDLLIGQLDRTEAALGQVRAEARRELAAAEEEARGLRERIRQLEEAGHRHLLSQADLTRRESALASRQRELQERERRLEFREREVEEREQALRGRDTGWWTAGPASDE